MSNYRAIRDLVKKLSGQENVLTIPRIYIEYTGDLTTAALLNQIVFYSDKSKRTDGFFYKTYEEWEKEICLTKRQVKYSTDKLKALGVVETKLKKANGAPTLHYKLDYDKLVDSIVTKCHFPLEQNVTIDNDNLSLSLTENTTENTTEIKPSVHQDELFENWWNLYNKKAVDKQRSKTKYKSLLKEFKNGEIEEGTKRYLAYLKKNNTDKKYQKNPMTFLNGKNFLDTYEEEQVQQKYGNPVNQKPFRPDSVDLGDEA